MLGENVKNRWWLRPQVWLMTIAVSLLWAATGGSDIAAQTNNVNIQAGANPMSVQPTAKARVVAAGLASRPVRPPHRNIDCEQVACMALTFDDGPDRTTTPMVLQALKDAHVPATFFVIGSQAAAMPELVQRIYYEGHEIGNHTWSHPDLTKLSSEQISTEITQTQAAIVAAGVPAPTLFRPPYGAVSDEVRSTARLPIIMWNNDPEDWRNRDATHIVNEVKAQARRGAIIDLHDIYSPTAAALPVLLADLKKDYQLVTVSDLLNLQPGQTGEFFAQ